MTEPRRIVTSSTARDNVLHQLERAYERMAIQEQLHQTNEPDEAEQYHVFAVRLLRARLAEEDDPDPGPPCGCIQCAAVYAAGGARTAEEDQR